MKISVEETQPKLHEAQQQQHYHQPLESVTQKNDKMKFNWRSNWEILLVLVIIVVGIVITTIAAIRNKDESSDGYGHLLSSAASGHQQQVPPLPQIDFQMTSGAGSDDSSADFESITTNQPNVNRQPAPKEQLNTSSKQQQQAKSQARPRKSASQQQQQQQSRSPNSAKQHSSDEKFASDDLAEFNQPSAESYDALGTEPTPSQTRAKLKAAAAAAVKNPRRATNPADTNHSRPPKHQQLLKQLEQDQDQLILLDDSDELYGNEENFRPTTRGSASSSAATIGVRTSTTESPLLQDNNNDNNSNNLHHQMHGPYGSMPMPSLASTNQTMLLQANPGSNPEDMMTSFSRENSTDPHQRQQQQLGAATLANSSLSGDQQDLIDFSNQQQQLQRLHRSNLASLGVIAPNSALPFSVLLNDLLKLTRPPLVNPQAPLERPANSRAQQQQSYNGGILQQLRQLPGPLLAFLQGTGGGGSSSSSAQANHQQSVYSDYGGHEVSASNQHYQQLPMSPMDVFSAATLRDTNPLPAFPAPKGSPSIWYPPTMGGNPSIHDAMNSNSDFVATNVAGFVRSPSSGGAAGAGSAGIGRSAESLSDRHDEYRRQGHEAPAAGATNQHSQTKQAATPSAFNNNNQNRQQFVEFGGQPGESVALAKTMPTPGSQVSGSNNNNINQQQQQHTRNKRSIKDAEVTNAEVDEEEELLDSRPVSIVMPDGRPPTSATPTANLNAKLRAKNARRSHEPTRPTSSQRLANHLDFDQSALHHYASQQQQQHDDDDDHETGSRLMKAARRRAKNKQGPRLMDEDDHYNPASRESNYDETPASQRKRLSKLRSKHKKAMSKNLVTAGSGLMSKLLGTSASTTDELEDDFDGDENEAQERRKEELDDAEFGIANDRPNAGPEGAGEPPEEVNRLSALGGQTGSGGSSNNNNNNNNPSGHGAISHESSRDNNLGSGSTDNEAYTFRNQQQQQRADVEFYGHPGEETRQLKYGILGSGNYEVVNGGIYPEADESTAAVNSVANYVRKPGGVLLAAGLAPSGSSGHPSGAQGAAAFMPGARITGGFMRGASANPHDLAEGFVPAQGAPGFHSSQQQQQQQNHQALLELIESGQHLFDPNLVAQLGSSGTSARTTYTSKDEAAQDEQEPNDANNNNNLVEQPTATQKKRNNRKKSNRLRMGPRQHLLDDDDDGADNSLGSSSDSKMTGSSFKDSEAASQLHQALPSQGSGKSQSGTNQFYSYQILPSKKVTIFSDQDLDSASSNSESIVARSLL